MDLCAEAIRLGRLVQTLMGPQPPSEVVGFLALMFLHDSRRDARSDDNGNLIVLEDQDRGPSGPPRVAAYPSLSKNPPRDFIGVQTTQRAQSQRDLRPEG